MSFENAPVTKGLMVGLGLTSILVGLFDVKHYFHLQLVPHLSRHFQIPLSTGDWLFTIWRS